MLRIQLLCILVAIIGYGAAACAAAPASVLRLPAILSDNMVLQQGKPLKIWGWAAPDQTVTVSIAGQTRSANADAAGKWGVTLDPLAPGDAIERAVRTADSPIVVRNILVGEVWVCAGQSNMQMTTREIDNAVAEIKAAELPLIRLFNTAFHAPEQPADDVEGKWLICTPQTAADFSAVAYLFGREVHQVTKLPVGLIRAAQGATAAESWISDEALAAEPILEAICYRKKTMVKDTKGWDPHLPAGLFNGKIAPLTRFGIRGVVWYQGETNGNRAFQYRTLFPLLIHDWRKAWGEDVPFYFVQLAGHFKAAPEPANEPWAELREAQSLALSLPNTGMAVAIDVGDAKNIHPTNKQAVAHRLARVALAKTYGQNIVYSGPTFREMAVEGPAIRIRFNHADGGLKAAEGGALKRFAIAGADQKFVWANAVIDGDSVLISNPKVPQPVAVRYAWANNPEGCNLVNGAGLPASPFRTDEWPGVTEQAHLVKPEVLAAWKANPVPPARKPNPYLDPPSAGVTGNTLDVKIGDAIERTWDDVRADGYRDGPKQAVLQNGETRIWLPYGRGAGIYYELANARLSDPVPGLPPALLVEEGTASSASVVLKLKFDKPIGGFRLQCGPAIFRPAGAVAGVEYSTDGQAWKPLAQTDRAGQIDRFADPDKARAAGLSATDLYLRFYVRGKTNADEIAPDTTFRLRLGGDPMWGDAAQTFFNAQAQLFVTPAGK